MTAFTKENLFKDGPEYVIYRPEGAKTHADYRFVARFKYGAKTSIGPFMTFLRRNFTVEEYFARIDAGECPLEIAESKGFMLSHIKKWLRQGGYPVNQAGFEQFLADQQAAREARNAA